MTENTGISKDIMMMGPNDNTAVCLRDLTAGEKVSAEAGTKIITANVQDNIPRGHKICVREIQMGASVIKYGEIIGKANADIHIGQHVHVHNVVD